MTEPVRTLYVPKTAIVREVKQMTDTEMFLRLELESGEPLAHRPGQFVEISVVGVGEAPFSVSSTPEDPGFEFVIRKIGRVTKALHRLQPEDTVGVRGPLGTALPLDDRLKDKNILFMAGGLGLVPLRSSIRHVLQHREQYGEITICYGSRTPAERLFCNELEEWAGLEDVAFLETVDKADATWKGHVGVLTELIPKVDIDPQQTVAILCGPPVMYKFVVMELHKRKLPSNSIYLSLERRMKCGLGKCGHCQINGVYTCLEGPVFNYADLEGTREAI